MFDRWYDAPEPETEIRFFQEVLALLLGGRSEVETVGLTPSTVLVVETDGAIEQVDALKSAFEGAASTGLHVANNPFDQAFEHPGVVARQIGRRALCAQCQACSVRDVCGGGFYPHRYRPGSGFLNPSVYCADLLHFISHVGGRVRADLARVRADVT
jgi:uncharacterized protein